MASFVPNHQKKKEHLLDREDFLRRLVQNGASNDELLKAAAEVRDARVRVIRVKEAIGRESLVDREAHLRIKRQIAAAQAVSAGAIVDEFLRVTKGETSE